MPHHNRSCGSYDERNLVANKVLEGLNLMIYQLWNTLVLKIHLDSIPLHGSNMSVPPRKSIVIRF